MAAPRNRSELMDIAHPAHKVVYHRHVDKDGKKAVVPYTLPEIDAHEAVTRYPNDYSYEEPENAGPLLSASEAGVFDPYAVAPAAPVHTSPAGPMGPVTGGAVMQPAALTEAAPIETADRASDQPPVAVDGVTQKVVAGADKTTPPSATGDTGDSKSSKK